MLSDAQVPVASPAAESVQAALVRPGVPSSSAAEVVKTRFYRPELDGLRFFAFFAVFIHHSIPKHVEFYTSHGLPFGAAITGIVKAGSFGVDLFFVLSAYLITELLLREREQFGTVDVKAFYARRILRIWPLYFFALAIAFTLPHWDSSQSFSLSYLLAFFLLCGNWATSLYGAPVSVMALLWSVSLEEQFYLVWPLVIRKLQRRHIYVVAWSLLFGSIASRLIVIRFFPLHGDIIPNSTLTRLDPFAAGMLLAAFLSGRVPRLTSLHRTAMIASGLIAIFLCGYYFRPQSITFALIGYPLIALSSVAMLAAILGFPKTPSLVKYLGKISYGLYVYHMLVFHFVFLALSHYYRTVFGFILCWITALLITVLVAFASYELFESRFLHLKERFARVQSRPV
jgi:peptidoglycan/LPS O-acetylase OafA/YrhL